VKIILNDGSSYIVNPWMQFEESFQTGNKLLDLISIAQCFFLLEDEVKTGKRIKEIDIPLCESYSHELSFELELLTEFLFHKNIKVKLLVKEQRRFNIIDEFLDGYTCLFSGGIDSFSGILNTWKNFGNANGLATVHADQRQLKKLLRSLQKNALEKYSIPVMTADAVKNKNYTRVSRGILYILNAMLAKNKTIVISEIGPTMYQPHFTVLDDVSLTTHPQVVKSAKKICQEVLKTDLAFLKPNENLTKAEVVAVGPEKEYLKETCSCRTIRFCNRDRKNCGCCYGCVIRKVAMLVADVNDAPCRDEVSLFCNNGLESSDNILHLANFSLNFLGGYENMPRYVTETIKQYDKEAVFERFSLDTFSALWILKKQEKLNDKTLLRFLDSALKSVTADELENRIASVREEKFKPDFTNKI